MPITWPAGLGDRCDAGDADAAGVGGEDAASRRMRIDVLEDPQFQVHVFRGGFHNKISVLHAAGQIGVVAIEARAAFFCLR
jgi:hypothetical protein